MQVKSYMYVVFLCMVLLPALLEHSVREAQKSQLWGAGCLNGVGIDIFSGCEGYWSYVCTVK